MKTSRGSLASDKKGTGGKRDIYILCALSVALFCILGIAVIVEASEEHHEPLFGEQDGPVWDITKEGNVQAQLQGETLYIRGSGTMKDYNTPYDIPWKDYKDSIKYVEFASDCDVKNVGKCAFFNMTNLYTVTLNNALCTIGDTAFYGCSKLYWIGTDSTAQTMPDCLETIGTSAFEKCIALKEFNNPNGQVTSIGNRAFIGCTSLVKFDLGYNGIDPNASVNIGSQCFENCSALKTVSLNDRIYNIKGAAFKNCSSLTDFVLPPRLVFIYEETFLGCESLKTFRSESLSVREVSDRAFQGCINLESAYFGPNLIHVYNSAFMNCHKLKTTDIFDHEMARIDDRAFFNCNSLEYIRLYAYNYIQSGSFQATQAKIVDTTLFNPYYGYKDIFGDTKFYVNGVEVTTDSDEFRGKTFTRTGDNRYDAMDVIQAGSDMYASYDPSTKTVTFYGKGTMWDLAGHPYFQLNTIEKVVFKTVGKTTISNSVFQSQPNLKEVIFSSSCKLTSIGNSAFRDCPELKTISLPSSLVTIGEYAFYNCGKLSYAYMMNDSSLETIGKYAFASTELQDFTFSAKIKTINQCAFAGTKLKSVTLPDSVRIIGYYAFSGSTIESIVIPGHMTAIGGFFLKDCQSLKAIFVKSNDQWTAVPDQNAFAPYRFYDASQQEISPKSGDFDGYIYVRVDSSDNFIQDSNVHNVKATSSDPSEGQCTGSGSYYAGEEVVLTATPKEFINFLGWYENGVLVTNDYTYKFVMGNEDRELVAKFASSITVFIKVDEKDVKSYSGGIWFYAPQYQSFVTYHLYDGIDLDMATMTFSGIVEREGYYIDGYKLLGGGDIVTKDNNIIEIVWKPVNVPVQYNSNNDAKAQSTATLQYKVPYTVAGDLFPTLHDGYTFKCWNTSPDGSGTTYEAGSQIVWGSEEPLQLYAVWEPESYTIKFNSSGVGTGEMPDLVVKYGESVRLTKNTFVWSGYQFQGWKRSEMASSVVEFLDEQYVKDLGNITLYAAWNSPERIVTYDVNGGEWDQSRVSYVQESQIYTINSKSPEKAGYKFECWTDGTTTYAPGQQIVIRTNINLVAVWSVNTYTILFTGGEGTMTPFACTYDEYVTLPANTLTKTGYVFRSWTSSVGTFYDCDIVFNLAKSGTVMFTAQWDPIEYYITFDPNGGTGEMASMYMIYGKSDNLDENIFQKEGYKFIGWATSPDGEVVYTDKESVSNLSSVDGSEVKLYAKWEVVKYTIKFDKNGGTGTMSDLCVNYGEPTQLKKNTFTNGESKFCGWLAPDGTKYYDCETICLTGGPTTITLKAIWSAQDQTHKVTFDTNGGTGEFVPIYIESDTIATVPYEVPAKTGNTFIGWKASNGALYLPGDSISIDQDVTLVAQWEPNTYVIEYVSNDGQGQTEQQIVFYDETVLLSYCNFTREGFFFVGWNTMPDGSGTTYTSKQAVTNLAESGTFKLYAMWGISNCMVAVDYGDGESTYYLYLYGNYIPREDIDKSREGKVLLGWYCDGELYDFNTELTEDIVLVARWGNVSENGTVVINNTHSNEVEVDLSTNSDVKEIVVIFEDTSLILDLQGQELRPEIYISMYETSTPGRYSIETVWLSDGMPFEGKITVTLPYNATGGGVPVVYYYAENGEKVRMDCFVDQENGTVTFVTYHNSEYGVEYEMDKASNSFVVVLAIVAVLAAVLLSMALVPRKH